MSVLPFGHEADQLARDAALAVRGERRPADEERLGRTRPAHADFERIGQAIGVLTDDYVSLFEPQNPLRLDAEARQSPLRAGVQQAVPEIFAATRRDVDFVAQFADEADAHDPGGISATCPVRTPI